MGVSRWLCRGTRRASFYPPPNPATLALSLFQSLDMFRELQPMHHFGQDAYQRRLVDDAHGAPLDNTTQLD